MIQLFSGRALPRVEREAAGGFRKPLRGSCDGSHRGHRHTGGLERLRAEDKVQEDGGHGQVHGGHLQSACFSAGS